MMFSIIILSLLLLLSPLFLLSFLYYYHNYALFVVEGRGQGSVGGVWRLLMSSLINAATWMVGSVLQDVSGLHKAFQGLRRVRKR